MIPWLGVALGLEMPEHGLDRTACPAYEEMIRAIKRRANSCSGESKPAAEKQDHLYAYGRHWANEESIAALAREAGMSWNRLWSELTKLGYTKDA
jgi:hypothetical protein